MDFRELGLQHVELYIAAESADVLRQLLHIGPRNCLVLDRSGEAANEIRNALQADAAQKCRTRTIDISDEQPAVMRGELYVIDDLNLVVVVVKHFFVEQMIL